MGLAEDYEGLLAAMLFHIETMERAHPLSFDFLLKPWIRDELDGRRRSLDWSDSSLDLAFITSSLVAVTHQYGELRERLFSDMAHIGPEPPWRTVGVLRIPNFALRGLPRYPPNRLASYALQAVGPHPDVQQWDFTVLPAGPPDPVTHRIEVVADGTHREAELPDAVRDDPAALLQLGYGLAVLGSRPHLR